MRSSGDVLNRLEREMGREEFNDTRPEIAFKRMYVVNVTPLLIFPSIKGDSTAQHWLL